MSKNSLLQIDTKMHIVKQISHEKPCTTENYPAI